MKILATGQKQSREFPSGPALTAKQMVGGVKKLARDWKYDAVSIGYPGPVVHNRILLEPRNLGRGWVNYDFAAKFGKPTRVINDAAMQALGSYEGGRMLFLGLGTGLGTTFIIDKMIAPMQTPHRSRTLRQLWNCGGLVSEKHDSVPHRAQRSWRRQKLFLFY